MKFGNEGKKHSVILSLSKDQFCLGQAGLTQRRNGEQFRTEDCRGLKSSQKKTSSVLFGPLCETSSELTPRQARDDE